MKDFDFGDDRFNGNALHSQLAIGSFLNRGKRVKFLFFCEACVNLGENTQCLDSPNQPDRQYPAQEVSTGFEEFKVMDASLAKSGGNYLLVLRIGYYTLPL